MNQVMPACQLAGAVLPSVEGVGVVGLALRCACACKHGERMLFWP